MKQLKAKTDAEISNYLDNCSLEPPSESEYTKAGRHDVLDFCRKNKVYYPTISKLWQKYLSISASSAPVERVFSSVKLLLDGKHRTDADVIELETMHRYNNRARDSESAQLNALQLAVIL